MMTIEIGRKMPIRTLKPMSSLMREMNGSRVLASIVGAASGLTTFELPDISAIQPHVCPEAQVMANITATTTATELIPVHSNVTKRAAVSLNQPRGAGPAMRATAIQIRNGKAIAAVAFNATPTAISALPSSSPATGRSRRPARIPSITSAIIIDSVCSPPMRCTITRGLATPSHTARSGSLPSSAARRRTTQISATKATRVRNLNTNIPAVTLSPVIVVTPLPSHRWPGPYGVVVLRQSAETS